MDRKWIKNPNRLSDEYKRGVQSFLEVASKHVNAKGKTKCPCIKCLNHDGQTLSVVKIHLRNYGISTSYDIWTSHGETVRQRSQIPSPPMAEQVDGANDIVHNILNDAFPHTDMDHMGQDLAEDEILRGNEDVMDDDHVSHGMRVNDDQYEKLMAEA
ncbi:hypothetical protein M0R45_016618 [Rubus argutus]|uniref:Transposase-associated domain-containing protein n=1 Tax=Rubus argutus TaxID=59490 RepID=A0AAW1XT87_RUBAR